MVSQVYARKSPQKQHKIETATIKLPSDFLRDNKCLLRVAETERGEGGASINNIRKNFGFLTLSPLVCIWN